MLEKDEGIVLGATRSGETSITMRFLGRRSGKVRLMAKGAMRPKHPSHGALQPGNHIEVLYYRKENRTVFFLKETSILHSARSRNSLEDLATLLAAMELLDGVCFSGIPDPAVVDTGIEYLSSVGRGDALLMFLAFELKLLAALGVCPQLSQCATCEEPLTQGAFVPRDGVSYCSRHKGTDGTLPLSESAIEFACLCGTDSLVNVGRRGVDPLTRKQLGKIVHWTYTYHVQGYSLPKSLSLI